MHRIIAAAALVSLTTALPAMADENPTPVAAAVTTMGVPVGVQRALARPAALPALYAGYAALQAYDIYSTRQALGRGAQEANPLMQGAVGNTAAFVALKASVAAGTILAAERLWKNDKKAAAIGVMVASNVVAAMVASKNARTLRQMR